MYTFINDLHKYAPNSFEGVSDIARDIAESCGLKEKV